MNILERKKVFAPWLLLLLTACIRPVELTDLETDEILVVDALITDEDKRQEVRLSITTPVSSVDSLIKVRNASVYMMENETERIDLLEDEPGIYRTEENMRGIVGNQYQLFINLEEGRSYESSPVIMQATPEIDSIYAEFTPNPIVNRSGGDFEFFVDSRNNDVGAKFLRWTWQAASTLKVANPSRFEWLGGNDFRVRELGGDNSEDQVEQCWINQPSALIIIEEEPIEGLGFQSVRVNTFHSDSRAMSIDYGIEVTQYALSDESFAYWELLADATQGSGFLFDRQVGSIPGNVRNIENPEEIVLGYFEAAEVRRTFRLFNHLEFGDAGFRRRSQFFVDCFDVQPRTTPPSELGVFMEEFFPAWEIAFFITDGPAVFYPQRCSNCTIFGDNQRPDYWVE